jgi:hypothetical protein
MNGNLRHPFCGFMVYVRASPSQSFSLADTSLYRSGIRKDYLMVIRHSCSCFGLLMLSTSSTLIEEVQYICQTRSATLAFFYFDHQDVTKQDARSLLSSLLIQLCEQSDRFSDLLSALFMQHGRGSRQPNEHALMGCLKEMISLSGGLPVYIIMDGLDECPDSSGLTSPRAEVLQIVQELVDSYYSNVHICVTSRLEVDILRVLEPLTVNSMSLRDQLGQVRDVNYYISSIIHSNSTMRKWPEEEKQSVVDTLTLGHDGM